MVSFASFLSLCWATAVLASASKHEQDIRVQPEAQLVRRDAVNSTVAPASTIAPSSTPIPSVTLVPHYGQCGGVGWTGPTVCAPPYTCLTSCTYYHNCL